MRGQEQRGCIRQAVKGTGPRRAQEAHSDIRQAVKGGRPGAPFTRRPEPSRSEWVPKPFFKHPPPPTTPPQHQQEKEFLADCKKGRQVRSRFGFPPSSRLWRWRANMGHSRGPNEPSSGGRISCAGLTVSSSLDLLLDALM